MPNIYVYQDLVGLRGIMSSHPRNILPLFVGRASIVSTVKLITFALYPYFFLQVV